MPEPTYTDAQLDAAIDALTDPARLREGQDLVMRAAPSLQRVLAAAIAEGGWFDSAHTRVLQEATSQSDEDARLRAVRTLMAEETRLGMLVGVAVGFELARALQAGGATDARVGEEQPAPEPEPDPGLDPED